MEFFLGFDRLGTGAGAQPAHVQQVGPGSGQFQAVLDRPLGIEELPAVGEAVGGDVEDAHQERDPPGRERPGAEFPAGGRHKVKDKG